MQTRTSMRVVLLCISVGALAGCSSDGFGDELMGGPSPSGTSVDAGTSTATHPGTPVAVDASVSSGPSSDDAGGNVAPSTGNVGGSAGTATDASAATVTFHSAIEPSYATSLCLDVPGGNPTDGAQTEIDPCGSSPSQDFVFVRAADGTYTVTTSDGSLCLDALSGGSNSQTINAEESACSGSFTQTWRVVPGASSGTFGLTTVDGTGCLDVDGAGSSPGTQLLMWPCSGTPATKDESFALPGASTLVPSEIGTAPAPAATPGCTTASWASFGSSFTTSYCISCHSNFSNGPVFAEYGALAVEQIASGLMPQPGSPQPSSADVQTLRSWVTCGSPQ